MSDCSAGAQKSRVAPALPRDVGENENDMRAARGSESDEIPIKRGARERTTRAWKWKTLFSRLNLYDPRAPTWW